MLRHSRMIRQLPDECLVRSTRFILKIIMDLKIFCRYFFSLKRSNKTKQDKAKQMNSMHFSGCDSIREVYGELFLSPSLATARTHTLFANNAHTNTHAHSLLSPNTNIFFSLGKLTCPSHTLALAYTSSLLFLSHSFKQCLCFNVSLSLQLFLSSRSLIHMLALLLLFHAV